MSDHDDHGDHGHEDEGEWRTTAPMQEYGMSQVGTGVAVLLVGLVLTFGVALALV